MKAMFSKEVPLEFLVKNLPAKLALLRPTLLNHKSTVTLHAKAKNPGYQTLHTNVFFALSHEGL